MQLQTHLKIDSSLNGSVTQLKEGFAQVTLTTLPVMAADKEGLVHGGFIFAAADYAAMAVVNDPYVVLAKSNTKFIAPVKVGQIVILEATITQTNGNKATVEVTATVEGKTVFSGEFFTAVLKQHVLTL